MVTGLLRLAPESVLLLDGAEWVVETIEAQRGQVLLRGGDGEKRWRTIRWLAHHPDCRAMPPAAPPDAVSRQPPVWDDLTGHQQEVVRLRVGHVLETQTGFRSGDPHRAGPGEPRPAYDPAWTTLGQRRQSKVAELKSLGTGEARLLGLGR